MKLCFVLNPTAGKKKTLDAKPIIKSFCEDKNITYKIVETRFPGDATDIVKKNIGSYDGFIAIGGDGTLLETASGLFGTDMPLGVIPLGSGNDFARALNIPLGLKNVQRALSVIIDCPSQWVDIGKLDDRIFLNVSSIGFDAEIIRDLHKVRRFIKGGAAYAISVFLKFMTYKPKAVKIDIDGMEYDKKLFLVAVCNGISYGGGMKVNPKGSMTDGLLDLILIEPVPRYKIPFLLTKFMKGKHFELPYVSSLKCNRVSIHSDESLAINIDGESTVANTISFNSLPLSLRMFGASK